MQWIRPILIAAVSTTCVLAQESVYTLKVDVPVVSVDVAVFDADNKPVTLLGMEDFLIYEDGIPQQIRNFSPVSTPYNILLLFDRSGSTESQWKLMRSAVAGFLRNLRPQDGAAVVAFDADYQRLSGWSVGHESTLKSLDALLEPHPESNGVTELYRALEHAVDREFRGVTGRRALIAFTDGRDDSLSRETVSKNRVVGTAEDRSFQKTLRSIQKQQTPIYFVAVNTDRNLDPTDPGVDYLRLRKIFPDSAIPLQFLSEARTRMEAIANASGGRVFFPERIEDVIPLYDQVGREISSSYSLGYAPMSARKDDRLRHVEVRARGDGRRVWQSRTAY
jgi:VWFA-related protein